MIERKDYRTPAEMRKSIEWYRAQLELARAARRDADERLGRTRIEVHQAIDEQLQLVRAEIDRCDRQLEEAREAGQHLLAGQLVKIMAERRRRAAMLREIRQRIISAGLGYVKSTEQEVTW